jgi:hypothetical protein
MRIEFPKMPLKGLQGFVACSFGGLPLLIPALEVQGFAIAEREIRTGQFLTA